MYPSGKQVPKNGEIEMPLQWRTVYPRNIVDYNTPAPVAQIGYLVLAKISNSPTVTGSDADIKFTVEFDMSGVSYDIPFINNPTYQKTPFSYTSYPTSE
jgi:hypothetical protein